MLRVGLTGGIASGKSRVTQALASAGFFTLDLDRVAHEMMAPGAAAHAAVVDAFGPGIRAADGSIDRRRLGPLVFADPAARARLDALVHPVVRDEEGRRLERAAAEGFAVAVSDAALLVESGGHLRYDRLVVAWCPPDEQRRRLRARDGLDLAAAQARLDAQMPVDEKRRFGHLEVSTLGSLEETQGRAGVLADALTRLARAPCVPLSLRGERAAQWLARLPPRGPGGIEMTRLLGYLDAAPALEMTALAALLTPPPAGPWYRASRGRATTPGPEVLALPLARHCLERHGADAEFLAGAAASVARLTHEDPVAIATAVQRALEAAMALHPGSIAREDLRGLARRWGGADPDPARSAF